MFFDVNLNAVMFLDEVFSQTLKTARSIKLITNLHKRYVISFFEVFNL